MLTGVQPLHPHAQTKCCSRATSFLSCVNTWRLSSREGRATPVPNEHVVIGVLCNHDDAWNKREERLFHISDVDLQQYSEGFQAS